MQEKECKCIEEVKKLDDYLLKLMTRKNTYELSVFQVRDLLKLLMKECGIDREQSQIQYRKKNSDLLEMF